MILRVDCGSHAPCSWLHCTTHAGVPRQAAIVSSLTCPSSHCRLSTPQTLAYSVHVVAPSTGKHTEWTARETRDLPKAYHLSSTVRHGSTHLAPNTLNFDPKFGQLPPRKMAKQFEHTLNGPTGSQPPTHSPPTPAPGQLLGWGHANQECLANEQGASDRKPDMGGRSNRGRRVGTPKEVELAGLVGSGWRVGVWRPGLEGHDRP